MLLLADVAESADAQASGACGGNPVEVQLLSSAFFLNLNRWLMPCLLVISSGPAKHDIQPLEAVLQNEPNPAMLAGQPPGQSPFWLIDRVPKNGSKLS